MGVLAVFQFISPIVKQCRSEKLANTGRSCKRDRSAGRSVYFGFTSVIRNYSSSFATVSREIIPRLEEGPGKTVDLTRGDIDLTCR